MSNTKQQTAVEWYDNEIGKLFDQFTMGKIKIYEFQNQRFKLEKKAKEMEKQRMIEFAKQFIDVVNIEDKDIEIIYNETYGGDKQ